MNKKWLLGLGGIAAISLPVSTVVACGGDKSKKDPVVSVAKLPHFVEKVNGSKKTYTLAFVNTTEKLNKASLETLLKSIVTKASNDKTKVDFKGSWEKDFDISKDDTYTYKLKADGYNDVKFVVKVARNNITDITKDGTSQTSAADKAKKVLIAAQDAAKDIVKNLKYPKQEDLLHKYSLFLEIDSAKSEALAAINSAKTAEQATAKASSATKGTEILKILSTIKKYNSSTLTVAEKKLARLKAIAKSFVNGLAYPKEATGSVRDNAKFTAIATAKENALKAIYSATNNADLEVISKSSTEGTSIVAINTAITAYNNSIIAKQKIAKELKKAKTAALNFIDGWVNGVKRDDKRHKKSFFDKIIAMKNWTFNAINESKTKEELEKIFIIPKNVKSIKGIPSEGRAAEGIYHEILRYYGSHS